MHRARAIGLEASYAVGLVGLSMIVGVGVWPLDLILESAIPMSLWATVACGAILIVGNRFDPKRSGARHASSQRVRGGVDCP